MPPDSAEKQLAGFLARFSPPIARLARAARTKLRQQLPGAVEMIYDNYYALVIGFGPTERPSEAILSIVAYPRHVSVAFLNGIELPDPEKRLAGDGKLVRHIRLQRASDLEDAAVRALIREAVEHADAPFTKGRRRVIVRMVSAKQRPRRGML
ncbi:MAG: hypothetical protein DMF85_19970 [Acidobacteria bacterium]|nr:MAG: hypothetical protein DMF85_19970 [Acidobacteriota bacterium]